MPSNYGTRSNAEEDTVQRIVEKVLSSEILMNKIMNVMSEKIDTFLIDRMKRYEDQISKLQENLNEANDKLEQLEQFSRLDGVRLFGLPEKNDENITDQVVSLFNTKLQVDVKSEDISACYRLKAKEGSIRPVMIKFSGRSVKNEIYRAKSKFKGTKFILREDLTKQRASAVSDLNKRFTNKNVFTNSGNVFVKWNDKIHKFSTLNDYKKFIAKL